MDDILKIIIKIKFNPRTTVQRWINLPGDSEICVMMYSPYSYNILFPFFFVSYIPIKKLFIFLFSKMLNVILW